MTTHVSDSEEGFTLIETAVSLSIISVCVFFFSIAVTQTRSVQAHLKDDRQMEWHMYINQLEYDMMDTVIDRVGVTSLHYKKGNPTSGKLEVISHSTYGELVRRQVDDKGHQPMLTEVDTYRLALDGNRLTLTVTFETGDRFTAYLKVNRESKEETG